VVWNETDVHVLIAEGLGEGLAQVLKVGGCGGKAGGGKESGEWLVARKKAKREC